MTFQNAYQKTLMMSTKLNKLKVQKPWFRWFKGSIWTYIHVLHVTGFSSIPFDDWSELWSQVLAVEPFFIQGVQGLLTVILHVISISISHKFTCYHYLCNTWTVDETIRQTLIHPSHFQPFLSRSPGLWYLPVFVGNEQFSQATEKSVKGKKEDILKLQEIQRKLA